MTASASDVAGSMPMHSTMAARALRGNLSQSARTYQSSVNRVTWSPVLMMVYPLRL